MKAITYSRYGPPDVLRVEEVEKPIPGDDEVLIRVRAAEVTKSDCEMRAFKYSVQWFWLPLRLALGVRRSKRRILGGYLSGEVESKGKNVVRLSAGDPYLAGNPRLSVMLPSLFTTLVTDKTASFAFARESEEELSTLK